jgi:RimJ/RimL family protein N-acetyltransferase
MNMKIRISTVGNRDLVLRSISFDDLENLRRWKNENSNAFFHKKTITPAEQEEWFSKYMANSNNYMFVIEYRLLPIGCIGFRMIDGAADVYNVIIGEAGYKRKGLMSSSLALLCSYIINEHAKVIGIKVIKTNEAARNFYLKNGFIAVTVDVDHISMSLDPKWSVSLKVKVQNVA